MRIADLIVRQRLSIAFGVMVVISVVSGAVALSQLAHVQHNLDQIVKDDNAKIKLNHEMSEAVHVVSRVIPKLVLLHDKTEIEVEALEIARARQRYDDAWATLRTFPAGEASRLKPASILAAGQRARQLNEQVIELARADQDSEAMRCCARRPPPAAQAWQEAIDDKIASEKPTPQRTTRPPWPTTTKRARCWSASTSSASRWASFSAG